MCLRTLFRAGTFLMAGAIVAFLPEIGDAYQYQQQEQQQRVPEKECQPATASVSPSKCTVTTDTVDTGHPCFTLGGHVVVSSSCTDTVTTTADDKCDGPEGPCTPPTFVDTELAETSESADPSLSPGDCVGSNPVCTCAANGTVTYTYGRKKC